MGAVISSLVFTVIDQGGNPRTLGWFLWEFQENYATGGITADLSAYMRRLEAVICNPASGALVYTPRPNLATIPGAIASGTPRIELLQATVTSGQAQPLSGVAGAWVGPLSEIANATAVSGTRAILQTLGY